MTETPRRGLTIDDPTGPGAPPDRHDSRLRELRIDEIHPNPNQPRKHFDETSLAGLAESIGARGVLQPVIVRARDAGGYELVAGERRSRAAKLAGLSTIPALLDSDVDSTVSLELALIENVVREDLTPIEEARTISTLLQDLGVTTTALARHLGRSRSDVAHTVRLLELPDAAIDLIDSGALSKGHGKALLAEPDHDRRRNLARQAATGGWSVRRLEAEVARRDQEHGPKLLPHPDQVAVADRLEHVITSATGCAARARAVSNGYQLTVDQAGAERLVDALGGVLSDG